MLKKKIPICKKCGTEETDTMLGWFCLNCHKNYKKPMQVVELHPDIKKLLE